MTTGRRAITQPQRNHKTGVLSSVPIYYPPCYQLIGKGKFKMLALEVVGHSQGQGRERLLANAPCWMACSAKQKIAPNAGPLARQVKLFSHPTAAFF
jgi:hypothetical protein